MPYKQNLLIGGLLGSLVSLTITSATAQGTGVTGIVLQVAPNTVGVEWEKPQGIEGIDHYIVYYGKQSILENNGRFDEQEATVGDETSFAIVDLKNRSFVERDMIFVTIAAADAAGTLLTTFTEEQSIEVSVPGTTPRESASSSSSSASTGDAAPPTTAPTAPTVRLEHAIAESLTRVQLQFSAPIALPTDNPQAAFTIQEEGTSKSIAVVAAETREAKVILTTLPMIALTRYTMTVAESITSVAGAPLNPDARVAVFAARGGTAAPQIVAPPSLTPTPAPGGAAPTQPPVPVLLDASALLGASVVTTPGAPSIGGPPREEDTTPPEDARNLVLRRVLQSNGLYTVHASWEESLNSAMDLKSYNLYESANLGRTFLGPTALRATVTSSTIADVPPGTLTVKITAMDDAGNESEGIQKTIILPETGAAATLLLSLAGAGVWTARRKWLNG